jgi:hypothetical protein
MGRVDRAGGPRADCGVCDRRRRQSVSGRADSRSVLVRLVFVIVACGLGVFGGAQGADAACPNEALRSGQSSTFLPDCRAFELVSPPESEPYLVNASDFTYGARASITGGAIAWFSFYPLSGSAGGEFHNISTRGSSGWSTEPIGPRLTPTNNGFSFCEPLVFFSADLSKSILIDGKQSSGSEQPAEGECPGNNPALVTGEPEGFQNVFIRDGATGVYALANITPEGTPPQNAWLQDTSDDFSHVVFEDAAKLTQTAPVGASLYEWASGTVSLVTVLPNGIPTVGNSPGAVVGGGNLKGSQPITHPASADGTRVVFEAEEKLFLRENAEQQLETVQGSNGECLESAKACTVQLDASQAEGTGGGGSFVAANTTDTRIFFTDGSGAKLTSDTTPGSGQHLYEYDTQTGALNDLTPAGEFGLLGVSGISNDGAYLYVVARAALATKAVAGQPTAESPNLYVFHNGTPEFVATLGEGDLQDVQDWSLGELSARVSSNGRYLAFNSIEELLGYDNTPVQPEACLVEFSVGGALPGPCAEIFLYDAVKNELHCVSCTPSGARPTARTEIPQAEAANPGPGPTYMQRNVLDDGRVFFDTANSLLSGAGNDVSNVYQYEAGHLRLISTGTSEANSFFYDASPNGEDVFFTTTQHLEQNDTGNGMRLYDARVEGGFPEPEASVQCSGEGCRAQGTGVSAFPLVPTTGLQGAGNLAPPKHKVAVLSRRQKLSRALRACQHKKNKGRRVACRRQARKHYGTASVTVKRGVGK